MAESLEALGEVGGAQGQLERAGRLLGAAAALRDAIGAPLWPVDCAEQERRVAEVRAALGEDGFTAAWVEGRGLTLEEAIAEAQAAG